MLLRYPAYYDEFRCIAAACPDSCCKDWAVEVDAASAARYQALEGDLGEALRRALHCDAGGDHYFEIENGRCPFWQPDGLCRIQAEASHDALCATCRDFPRLTHDYGDFVEKGLCLSCPEAARLIFSRPARWEEKEICGGEAPEYDAADMALLLRTRQEVCATLADDRYSVPQALALALLQAYKAQGELDGQEQTDFIPEAELAFAASLAQKTDRADLLDFYLDLEILTETWREMLEDPVGGDTWPEALRTLAIYGVQRYWLQAISDLDLVGRAKMVILSCILVQHLGGPVPESAQKYAKEIENDQDNVDAILDGAYESPALTDARILGWLLL